MMYKTSILSLIVSLSVTFQSWSQVEIFSDHISLGPSINSTANELNIVLNASETEIYFTRKNHPENVGGAEDNGDIWLSEKNTEGKWATAYNLKSINQEGIDHIIGFLGNENTILIHTEKGFSISKKSGIKWLKPEPFSIPHFRSISKDLSGSVSPDGRFILIGMESFGSYGVEDIYVSRKKLDGSWTSLKSLGSQINTANQEITPFIAADNRTLFFSSNGKGGEGSFDVFMSTRLDDSWQKWSEPVNLGNKVNTNGWESSFFFNPESEYAYLISTQNSDGYADIKKVKITPYITVEIVKEDTTIAAGVVVQHEVTTFSGSIRDAKSKEIIIGAEVLVRTEPSDIEFKTLTNSEGRFTINIKEGNSYFVKVKTYKYIPLEDVLSDVNLLEDNNRDYLLEPVIEGNTVTLSHVLFEQAKAVLISDSEHELDLVVEMMRFNPNISIFLSGHTDNQGNASLNLKLSEDRVKTVIRYMTSQGVSKKRISGKGYGGLKPIASNANVESRKLNRRVEFTIHEISK